MLNDGSTDVNNSSTAINKRITLSTFRKATDIYFHSCKLPIHQTRLQYTSKHSLDLPTLQTMDRHENSKNPYGFQVPSFDEADNFRLMWSRETDLFWGEVSEP